MPGIGHNRSKIDTGFAAFREKLRSCEEARDGLELRLTDAEERCSLPVQAAPKSTHRKKSKGAADVQEGRKTKTLTWLPRVILESSTAQVAPTAKSQGNAAAMMRRGRSPNSPNKKKRKTKRKGRKKRKSKKGKTRRKSRKSKKGTKKRKNK